MNRISVFFFLFCASFLYGQQYKPLDTSDYSSRKFLMTQYETKHDDFINNLKNRYKGKFGKQIKKSFGEVKKNVINLIEDKKITFDRRFQKYVDSLLKEIVINYPEVANEKIRILISKSNTPNALNTGDGIVVLNMGLFGFLDNEQQLLSVLSHEIAHNILKHVESSIAFRSRFELSGQAKEIKVQKYGRNEKAFEMLKNILYAGGKKRRVHEVEADSLGYLIFKSTVSKGDEFIHALERLTTIDSINDVAFPVAAYKDFFDLPNLPFNDKWLEKEEFSGYNYDNYKDKVNKDSLKSHPEILDRIKILKNTFKELAESDKTNLNNDSKQPGIEFEKLKNISRQEAAANLFYAEKYGLNIYNILRKLHQGDYTDKKYFLNWLGKNFSELHNAKKKYQMNRHLDIIVPKEQTESYQQFLNFMWNLSLKDLKAISDYYLEER